MNSYRSEQGGIASFVIVGVVLAGVMLGGLYVSKHEARIAREGSTSGGTITGIVTESDTNYQSAAGDETAKSTDDAAATKTDEAESSPAAGSSNGGTPSVAQTGPSGTIAASGPTETAATIVGILAVVFATSHFLRSRQILTRSALR